MNAQHRDRRKKNSAARQSGKGLGWNRVLEQHKHRKQFAAEPLSAANWERVEEFNIATTAVFSISKQAAA
jgi:hypothetical protein